jgi:hypothetical protein
MQSLTAYFSLQVKNKSHGGLHFLLLFLELAVVYIYKILFIPKSLTSPSRSIIGTLKYMRKDSSLVFSGINNVLLFTK